MVGVYTGASHHNFIAFDIGGVQSTVTSAKLTLYSGTISAKLDYSLYGASQAINQLSDGVNPDTALYDELGQGVKYGSFVIDGGNSLRTLMFMLNAAAVSGIDAAILGKKTAIAISGASVAVPEFSTWIMMLAGFAGLGLAACRRSRVTAQRPGHGGGHEPPPRGCFARALSGRPFCMGDPRGVLPPSPIRGPALASLQHLTRRRRRTIS